MSLEQVKPGDSLSAVNENRKIATINELSDRVNTLHIPPTKSSGLYATIENTTANNILTGGVLNVSGIRGEWGTEKLISLYQTSKIQLSGTAVTASSSLIAVALEAIRAGGIGRCFIPGVFGGFVTIKNDAHQYAKPKSNGLESAVYGTFRLIGKSTRPTNTGSQSDYDGFGILQYNINGGHIIGTTQSEIGGSGTTDVAVGNLVISSIRCPLLRQGETIAAGSVVVMSWNPLENELQIIEAQCSGEEEEE